MQLPHILTSRTAKVSALLALFTILVCIGFWYFPWISDDLGYRIPFRAYFIDGEPVTFSQIWEQIAYRHFNDNSRWANIAMTLLIFTPKWLQAVLGAVAVFGSLWLPLRILNLQRSLTAAALWISAFVLLMPWIDQMYVYDFQLNYLWGGTLGVAWVYMCFGRRGSTVAFAAMSLLTGLWQEAVGFPIFAGFVAVMLLDKRFRKRRYLLAALCLLIGLAWLYLSPGGMKYRGGHFAYFAGRSNILYVFALPVILYLCCLAVRLWRRHRLSSLHIFLAVSAAVGTAVSLVSLYGPRVGWWGTMAALMGLLALLKEYRRSSRSLSIVASIALFFTAVHLIAVDYHSHREGLRYAQAVEQYMDAPDSTIFQAITLREYAPPINMQKPYFGALSHLIHSEMISEFYGSKDHPIKVVPEELKDYRQGRGRVIPGDRRLVEYRGYLIAPFSYGPAMIIPMHISTDPDVRGQVLPMYEVQFTDADGIRRMWVSYNTSSLQMLRQPIPARVDTVP